MVGEDDGLAGVVIRNQERLEKVLQQLKQTTNAPEKRLHFIAADVDDLLSYHWDSQELLRLETMVAVGVSAIETYLDTTPRFPKETETLIQETLNQLRRKDLSADEKMPLFQKIAASLKQAQDT